MNDAPKKRPWFQFSLLELIVVTLVIGAGLLVFLRIFFGPIPTWPTSDEYSKIAKGSIIFLLSSFAGACIGVYVANSSNLCQWRRIVRLLLFVLGSWVFVVLPMLFVFSSLIRSRMATGDSSIPSRCSAFAEAEEIYWRADHTGNGVQKYAPTLKDLFETAPGRGDLALIAKTLANAEGAPGVAQPIDGYVFKALTAQGKHAPGGKMSYIDANGNMTKGYALVACPAIWDSTGRYMYMISNKGTIYQKDCGPNSPQVFNAMTEFDPDDTWEPAD